MPPLSTPAARRAAHKGMTVAEIVAAMPLSELRLNVRRGGPAAIAEMKRRDLAARGGAPTLDMGIGV